ncbi:hypothetical protein LUZ60_015689 [Juncus effusus]|nr:hypothetical protein LUZ60_015689 [Juncus effusus]
MQMNISKPTHHTCLVILRSTYEAPLTLLPSHAHPPHLDLVSSFLLPTPSPCSYSTPLHSPECTLSLSPLSLIRHSFRQNTTLHSFEGQSGSVCLMAETPEHKGHVHDDEDLKHDHGGEGGGARNVIAAIIIVLLLLGVIALILYFIYRPTHPRFYVATVSVLSISNSTSPFNTITASFQTTLIFRNPNSRSVIHYDRLSMYLQYRNAPITSPTPLPPLLQAKSTSVVVSPVLGGPAVPVSPDVVDGLIQDQTYGVVPFRLIVVGKVRYEPGPFHSRWSSLYVRCDLLVGARRGVTGPVPLLSNPDCSVNT